MFITPPPLNHLLLNIPIQPEETRDDQEEDMRNKQCMLMDLIWKKMKEKQEDKTVRKKAMPGRKTNSTQNRDDQGQMGKMRRLM